MILTTTPRLIIRAFKQKDASALFDYLSSPRTPCFQDEKLNSLEDAIDEVDRRARDTGQFAVCLKRLIASSSLFNSIRRISLSPSGQRTQARKR